MIRRVPQVVLYARPVCLLPRLDRHPAAHAHPELLVALVLINALHALRVLLVMLALRVAITVMLDISVTWSMLDSLRPATRVQRALTAPQRVLLAAHYVQLEALVRIKAFRNVHRALQDRTQRSQAQLAAQAAPPVRLALLGNPLVLAVCLGNLVQLLLEAVATV